jgi:hypothetical protein
MFVFHPVNISKTQFLGDTCGNGWMYAQEARAHYHIINLFQNRKTLRNHFTNNKGHFHNVHFKIYYQKPQLFSYIILTEILRRDSTEDYTALDERLVRPLGEKLTTMLF